MRSAKIDDEKMKNENFNSTPQSDFANFTALQNLPKTTLKVNYTSNNVKPYILTLAWDLEIDNSSTGNDSGFANETQ